MERDTKSLNEAALEAEIVGLRTLLTQAGSMLLAS
jgi:hypothetical protein